MHPKASRAGLICRTYTNTATAVTVKHRVAEFQIRLING